ncbi:hypothetical protein D3C84_1150840 [compost metagenome]
MIEVVADGLFSRRLDQQCSNALMLRFRQVEILHKGRPIAVQLEGLEISSECLLQLRCAGGRLPAVFPLIQIKRRDYRLQKTDEKLIKRTAKVGTRGQ